MTEENKNLRDKVRRIENIAVNCLNNQPTGDDECSVHLCKALASIAQEADGFQSMVEADASDVLSDDGTFFLEHTRVAVHPENAEQEIAAVLSRRYGIKVKSFTWRIA